MASSRWNSAAVRQEITFEKWLPSYGCKHHSSRLKTAVECHETCTRASVETRDQTYTAQQVLATVCVDRQGGKNRHPHQIKTKSGLNHLYNQPILSRQHVTRRMSSSGGKSIPFVPHHGVKVTTPSGEYLIHKGPKFGRRSDAVIVPASSMSSAWKPKHSVKHGGGMTVGDAMKAANKRGSSYSLLTGNCIHAAKDVMKMKKK